MVTLTKENAIKAVRKNLDEQEWNPSQMYGESEDNAELDRIIARTIPEAIDAVNLAAPVAALEATDSSFVEEDVTDGVLSFRTDKPVLRFVSVKAADSEIVLSEAIPENSAEARKQLNRYVRGTYDNPVIVMKSGTRKRFKYYTINDRAISKTQKIADYLYEYNVNALDYGYAKEYFQSKAAEVNIGGCSSARFGNTFGRNLDWLYSNMVDFVVRTPAANGRHAVMGVAGGLSGLTKAIVESGADSDLYRILPFYLQDGINDAGLFCNVNVVIAEGQETPSVPEVSKKDSICTTMLVRYILDNFSTKEEAVNYIRDYVELYAPQALKDMGYDVHFMIGDPTGTLILEIIDHELKVIDDYSWMTNFYLYSVEPGTPSGEMFMFTPANVSGSTAPTNTPPDGNALWEYATGLERWNIIAGEYDEDHDKAMMRRLMNDLLFSKAYKRDTDPFWYSEFVHPDGDHAFNVDTPPSNAHVQATVEAAIAAYENRSRNNPITWHTTHSCVYDLVTKELNIVSQEDTENEYDLAFDPAPSLIEDLSYITFASPADSYEIGSALLKPVMDYLTGLVLAIYGETEKANYFFQKANLQ